MLLWRDCLCPCDVAAVGSNQLCGMGVMRHNVLNWQRVIHRNRVQRTRFLCLENESKGLVFSPQKPSPMDSVSVHRNRVQRTRFLCIENEFIVLVFYALKPSPQDSISLQRKPSPLDSFSMHRNRVHWTRFLCITHCQFRTLCLITPIPHSWLLPTAATSRGHKQSLHSSITPQPSTWHNSPPNITWVPADSFT